MAETILFNLPVATPDQDPAYIIEWYQASGGMVWPATPTDTILVSNLPIDPDTGKYIWESSLANPYYYHKIKTISTGGIESAAGFILPPRPMQVSTDGASIFGNLINEQDGVFSYSLGDTIDLIFKPEDIILPSLGDTLEVNILDTFGTVLSTVTADRVGDIFVAEYTIPITLAYRYNPFMLDESEYNSNLFYLIDRWNIPTGGYADFVFTVPRKIESATEDNSILQVEITGITDQDSNIVKDSIALFTTKLTPYYSSVYDVKDISRDNLAKYNNFTIARQIMNVSKTVDTQMRPNKIYHQDAYDNAVSNYVKLRTAYNLVLSTAQINEEEKQLDTFRYKQSTSGASELLKPILEQMRRFELFIWAGGNDTPFVSKTFEKGLYDPNRPQIGRSNLDITGWFPWVNTSINSFIANIDGNDVEVRGTRGITYHYLMAKFKDVDKGDAGYLSGI